MNNKNIDIDFLLEVNYVCKSLLDLDAYYCLYDVDRIRKLVKKLHKILKKGRKENFYE